MMNDAFGIFLKTMQLRYTLRSDESGHDYLIKDSDSDEFERLLYEGTVEEFEEVFEDCRLNYHTNALTFTNPQIAGIDIVEETK